MLTTAVHSLVSQARPSHEDFYSSMDGNDAAAAFAHQSGWTAASVFITLIIVILLLSFIGLYLWNEVVAGSGKGTGLFTFAKPADSIWQILGLYVIMSLLFGGAR